MYKCVNEQCSFNLCLHCWMCHPTEKECDKNNISFLYGCVDNELIKEIKNKITKEKDIDNWIINGLNFINNFSIEHTFNHINDYLSYLYSIEYIEEIPLKYFYVSLFHSLFFKYDMIEYMHIDTRQIINEHSEIIIEKNYSNIDLYVYFCFARMQILYSINEYLKETNIEKRKHIYNVLVIKLKKWAIANKKPYIYVSNNEIILIKND